MSRRAHVDRRRYLAELHTVEAMTARAVEAMAKDPLSDSDAAWAKGCLEVAIRALDVIFDNDRTGQLA